MAVELEKEAGMPSLTPADELASVRAEIARLKARERALCDALMTGPACARDGRWTRIEIASRQIRLFDHRLLPAEIRDDPLFWRERQSVEVLCHPIEGEATALPVVARASQARTQAQARAVRLQ